MQAETECPPAASLPPAYDSKSAPASVTVIALRSQVSSCSRSSLRDPLALLIGDGDAASVEDDEHRLGSALSLCHLVGPPRQCPAPVVRPGIPERSLAASSVLGFTETRAVLCRARDARSHVGPCHESAGSDSWRTDAAGPLDYGFGLSPLVPEVRRGPGTAPDRGKRGVPVPDSQQANGRFLRGATRPPWFERIGRADGENASGRIQVSSLSQIGPWTGQMLPRRTGPRSRLGLALAGPPWHTTQRRSKRDLSFV